jgi:3-hydroxyisobutyrate dehydrogenase-like beta-hydroxyacid dehydrogenase
MDDEAVVACIGLGAMGAPLAHRLLVEGSSRGAVSRMVLWDRVLETGIERAAAWQQAAAAADGGVLRVEAVGSLEELSKARPQWVVTCLPTSADVASVAASLVPHLIGAGAASSARPVVWIDCTSGARSLSLSRSYVMKRSSLCRIVSWS